MRDEEGLAPVVAVMLILAVLVTFLSVYYASVLPTLKAESEIYHLRQVEEGFSRLDAVMYDVLSHPDRESTFKVTLPLGGGDIFFDSTRSAGTIRINLNQSHPAFLTVHYSGTENKSHTSICTISNVTYLPDGNFWLNQGYSWQYGYVNVTQGAISTPLCLDTETDAKNKSYNYTKLLLPTILRDWREDNGSGNLNRVQNITITLPSVSGIGTGKMRSGNGIQTIDITSTISKGISEDVTGKNITFIPAIDHEIIGRDNEWCNLLSERINQSIWPDDTISPSEYKDCKPIQWIINDTPGVTTHLNIVTFNVTVTLL